MRVCQEWFPETDGFYMEDTLAQQLEILAKNVTDDWDFTILITGQGEVRVGKSMLAIQIGCYWTYLIERMYGIQVPFDVKNNICLQWDKLIEQGNTLGALHKYCVLCYDEAGETMEGTKTQSRELKAVRDYLRECGQYNFLNILVLPEFFDLPKGIALTRSTFLIDVYYSSDNTGKFTRGYFNFYSRKNKKKLYLNGKKELNYHAHQYNFNGRFYRFYPIDEQEYRKAKQEALKNREDNSRDKITLARNAAWLVLSEKFGMKHHEIRQALFDLTGIYLERRTISKAIEEAGVRKREKESG